MEWFLIIVVGVATGLNSLAIMHWATAVIRLSNTVAQGNDREGME